MDGLLLAIALASAPPPAAPLLPTKQDVAQAITAHPYAAYIEPEVVRWQRDLQQALRGASVDTAADALAAKYHIPRDEMRRLVRVWVIAQAREYQPDTKWVAGVRAELRALAPRLRGNPLALSIAAEALDATTEDCSADDFRLLMEGAPDPAAAAYAIANASTCTGNFARASLADPARATPALIRQVSYGGLPPRDALPLYAWLTSPAALAHVREGDRGPFAAWLWQGYLRALFAADLSERALAAFDALPADVKARVVSPAPRPGFTAVVDGIRMTFEGEEGGGGSIEEVADAAADGADRKPAPARPRDLSDIAAPILRLAAAMAIAGREEEARKLLKTLPGLEEAKAAVACSATWTEGSKKLCPETRQLPIGALPLDHLLNAPDSDPYPIAEMLFGEAFTVGGEGGTEILCRVFPKEDYPDVCSREENKDYFSATTENAEEVAVAEAALEKTVPGFASLRASLLGDRDKASASAGSAERGRRASVTAMPPDYVEKPIPAQYLGSAKSAPLKGLAALPEGFSPVRVERAGNRIVAISVSQTYDPVGEVSGGGYWVHVSEDGGRHWDRPLYTGLADRFPYVVAASSRLPLIDGDTLHVAVDVAEIDTASISYPPVGLRTRRRAQNRFLTIPLGELRRDSDRDGITDVAAHHLLLDRPADARPFVVGSDYDQDCRAAPSPEKLALIGLLSRFTGNSGAAIVEPVDRPPEKLMVGWGRAAAAADQPIFLEGRRQDYACLASRRLIIVYAKSDLEALRPLTPDFHALEVPRIVFNRARDRGYVRWSLGWTGGTYRLRLVGGKWVFESISNWIT